MRSPYRKIFPLLFALLLVFLPLFSLAADSQSTTFTGKVVAVTDGDTIKK